MLPRLNKHMTLDQFRVAANLLRDGGIDLRAFILVKPPFLAEDEAAEWARRSLDFAFDCGASVAALIPTRDGNGAMEALAEQGDFAPPSLEALEAALDYGIGLARGRVFADLWDLRRLRRFSRCDRCFEERAARMRRINLDQNPLPPVRCGVCQ